MHHRHKKNDNVSTTNNYTEGSVPLLPVDQILLLTQQTTTVSTSSDELGARRRPPPATSLLSSSSTRNSTSTTTTTTVQHPSNNRLAVVSVPPPKYEKKIDNNENDDDDNDQHQKEISEEIYYDAEKTRMEVLEFVKLQQNKEEEDDDDQHEQERKVSAADSSNKKLSSAAQLSEISSDNNNIKDDKQHFIQEHSSATKLSPPTQSLEKTSGSMAMPPLPTSSLMVSSTSSNNANGSNKATTPMTTARIASTTTPITALNISSTITAAAELTPDGLQRARNRNQPTQPGAFAFVGTENLPLNNSLQSQSTIIVGDGPGALDSNATVPTTTITEGQEDAPCIVDAPIVVLEAIAINEQEEKERIRKLEEEIQELKRQMKGILQSQDDTQINASVEYCFKNSPEAGGSGSLLMVGTKQQQQQQQQTFYSKRVDKRTAEIEERLSQIESVKKRRENETLQNLTINKLRYNDIGFVGREREIETLKSCFDRMTMTAAATTSDDEPINDRKKELIFIKGHSGVGKSRLALTLEKEVTGIINGFFARGKFDLNSYDEPYSGIAKALRETCRHIHKREENDSLLTTIGQAILSELGSDGTQLLAMLIPELEAFSGEVANSNLTPRESFSFEAGHERWKYALRVLVRVLTLHLSPLVILLDDLQWADISSLEVLDYLISDAQNPNSLMIICAYRSDEIDEAHILSSTILDLTEKKEQSIFYMTDIELGSLTQTGVNKIIGAMLGIDDEARTRGLADICYRRTLGNPFFVIEFATMLREEELITFNIGLLEWTWDEELIEDTTMAAANVVGLLRARMEKLPTNSQLALQYAACLGSSFNLSTLQLLWVKHAVDESGYTSENLPDLMGIMVEDHFIEKRRPNEYRWVHDKVQEAAMSLCDDAEKTSFQFQIGLVLYRSLSDEELEVSLFEVVDLINQGSVGLTESLEFAELNLRAAEKGRSLSAFQCAATYVSNGITLLPKDKWSLQRTLTLRLYSLGAELELALGRMESMERYTFEVFRQEDCSTLDKLPVYKAKAFKLCNVEMNYKDSIEFGLDVLKDLGCNLVLSRAFLPVQAISSLFRTLRMAKLRPQNAYQTPVVMTDPKHIATMDMLFRIGYASYMSKNDFLLVLSSTRMVRMTLKYGVSEMAGPAYASLAIAAVAALGDYRTASFLAETALVIHEKFRGRYTETTVIFQAYTFALAYTKPLQDCKKPFSNAFISGMRSGCIEHATWALVMNHIHIPFQMGTPLGEILAKCDNDLCQIEELKQQDQSIQYRMVWQVILNLTGRSSESIKLKGKVFDCDTFHCTTSMQNAFLRFSELVLFVFFGDFEHAAELAIQVGDSFVRAIPAFFMFMMETFHRGVALYAMARKTKKKKYRTHANRIRKTIKKWAEIGNPNVLHYNFLLRAEQAALGTDKMQAEAFYREAIRLAVRTGYSHDVALFHERYADFLLQKEVSNEIDAKYHLEEAFRYYTVWGAKRKAQMLHGSYRKIRNVDNKS